MSYQVLLSERAQKQINALPQTIGDRITEKIYALKENPRPQGAKKLAGGEGYRIRVGDYRIVYDIQDAVRIVTIVKVGHRKDIYR